MDEVTDPAILAKLNATPVIDPKILAKLEGKEPSAAPTTKPPGFIDDVRSALTGGLTGLRAGSLEAAANMASGMIAAPVSNVAGLAAMGKEMISPSGGDPLAFKNYVQQQLTYEPRTPQGRLISQYNPMALAGQGVDWAAQQAGKLVAGPAGADTARGMAGSGVAEAIRQAPGFAGAWLGEAGAKSVPARQAELDIAKGLNKPRDVIRQQAQGAGLVTPPEGTSWLASIPGFSKLTKWISAGNEPKFNELVAKDVGIQKGTAITPSELEAIRDKNGAPYRAVTAAGDQIQTTVTTPGPPSAILGPSGQPIPKPPTTSIQKGFQKTPEFKNAINGMINDIVKRGAELPETFKASEKSIKLLSDYANDKPISGPTTVKAVRQLRKDAAAEFKSDDPTALMNAFTRRSIADELEKMMDANLVKAGKADLVKDLQKSRQTIAKTYDIESALDNTGNVNARKLYLISQKRPFSGNLKLVADYAGAFPEGAQKVPSGMQAVSPWDLMFATGALATGHVIAGVGELAGRAGIPMMAQRGMLQARTPSYTATNPYKIAPPLGIGASMYANMPPVNEQTPPNP